MYDNFNHFRIKVGEDVGIFGTKAGSGPPLLLLHGFPQNHLIWHRIAAHLSRTYTIVVLDLRGYGRSSKPKSDERHTAYSKSVMAQDCVDVMHHLRYERFYLCGHDRGGRVAHKLCVDHPERIIKAMFLDIAPTAAMYDRTNALFAKAYYHWFFLIQDAPYPEKLIGCNPESFLEHHVGRFGAGKDVFVEECYASYLEMMKDPECVHAMCEDYRAAATIDLEQHRHDEQDGRKILCPVNVLWGKHAIIEKGFDAVAEWQKVSSAPVVGKSLDCGHYIPEEAPEALMKEILAFFKP